MQGAATIDQSPAIDGLDDVLDIAIGVLDDYAGEHGSRIERMARWIVDNLGEVPMLHRHAELAADYGVTVWSSGDAVWVTASARGMSPDDARFLASALIRAARRAEE